VIGNGFDVEPTTLVEGVFLYLGDEITPDIEVAAGPEVWPSLEDIVRQDIIVAKGGNDWNDLVICRIVIRLLVVLSEDFVEFSHEQLVELGDLLDVSGNFLIVVVTRRIASPDDKVDRVLELVANPVEGGIDE
jgi:hypothetical protein